VTALEPDFHRLVCDIPRPQFEIGLYASPSMLTCVSQTASTKTGEKT
jgi:hypothetical protein